MPPDAPEPLRLALEDGDEPGQVRELTPHSTLRILLTNDAAMDGTVLLRARAVSRGGFSDREIARVDVGARETVGIAIEGTDLGLPTVPFDFSGSLTLDGTLIFGHENATNAVTLHLAFHPVQQGWMIYDAAAREDQYDGGALTQEARRRRTEAAELTAQARAEGRAVTVVAGDSFLSAGDGR